MHYLPLELVKTDQLMHYLPLEMVKNRSINALFTPQIGKNS